MKQLIICICILIIVTSCEFSSHENSSGNNKKPVEITSKNDETSADSISIFLTGNMLGKLKPCGCSGGQLGGLDRRPAIFNTVPADKRLIIDTGSMVEDLSDQSFFKFIIIMESLKYLDYDVVNLTSEDLDMVKKFGSVDTDSVGFISSYPTEQQLPQGNRHVFSLDGQKVNISVMCYDPCEMPINYIKDIFPKPADSKIVNILIINNYNDEIVSEISKLGVVDCLICPIPSDEPTITSEAGAKPIVLGVGRYGRHIGKLVIKNDSEGNLKLSFEDIRVVEELKQDAYLVQLRRRSS